MSTVTIEVVEHQVTVTEVDVEHVVITQETATQVIEVGIAGPQGPPGEAGSAPQAYEHTQLTPSTVWTIVHGLGYRPNYRAFDALSRGIEGDADYPDTDTLVLTFSALVSGAAYLS